jgi:hypothetical protein
MKLVISFCLIFGAWGAAIADDFDPESFAESYFDAWAATQSPDATKENLEHYLSFLTDDVGHQHLPYDPDGSRNPDGKESIREGMTYYLGAHTAYSARLMSHTDGFDVFVIKYESSSKGVHPQTQQLIVQSSRTLEVLEIEDGKVSVIRKYSE